jgi:iron complex outermembrane receptor protein
VAQRYQQEAYPVWDAEMARERGRAHPYVRMTNLSNTGYQEIAGVPIPGRAFIGGVELVLGKH